MVTIKHSARVILLTLVVAIFAQLGGWFSGLVAITESFPTASHTCESGVIVVCLFSSLLALAFDFERISKIALIIIGALAFYSIAGLAVHIRSDSPLNVSMFWGLWNLVLAVMLGWVLVLGYAAKAINWRELFISMALSYTGLIYLGLAK